MEVIEDQKPRRDKYIEARGTWAEVGVGAVLALEDNRSNAWEVIATKTPDQWEFGRTSWFRVKEVNTGEVRAVRPKMIKARVKFLLRDADQTLPPRAPLSDADEARLLLESVLGAQEIYTQTADGVITCPWDFHDIGGFPRHLRVAHDIDTTAIEAVTDPDERLIQLINTHNRAHSHKHDVGKGGFPHRHVPEDHSLL